MKRLALMLSVAIMVVASVMPVFAQPSVEVDTVVKVEKSEDKNGKAIEIRLRELEGKMKELADNILKPKNLKKLLGDAYSDKLQAIDTVDMYVWDSEKGEVSDKNAKKHFPITVTFNVPGVTPDSDVVVLAYYDGEWQVLNGVKIGNGTVTGSFDNTAPLIFLVDGKSVSVTPSDGEIKSPKTGESDMAMYVALIATVAFTGVVVSRRKKTA